MSLASVLRGKLAAVAALLVWLDCSSASAQSEAAEALKPAASAARAPAGPLTVWVDADGAAFDKAKLQASLEQELGRQVLLTDDEGAAAVTIRFDGAAHADVRYAAPSGEQLSRRVDLPPDRERSVQVVSWLTVNLVRDEASELLDQLRARRKEEAEARAAADKAAAEQAAADKAAADKAAADKAAADKAAAEAARKRAEQAKAAENAAGGPPNQDQNAGLLRDPLRSFDAAVFTPLSIVRDSPKRVLKLQLALAYGDAGGIEGIASSLLVLRVRRDLRGVATGTLSALVGGNARGVVLSGGYVQVDGVLDGFLMGMGAVWQKGPIARGALLGGGAVLTTNLTGAVVAGGLASTKSLYGVALAGGATMVRGPSKGVMLAGGVNFSADHRGIQLAGGVNAARDLDGLAIAPVNIHRRVKGFQLGVVNIAEEVDGAALGVISMAKNGRLQPVLWSSTDGSVHVALKSIAGWIFTQLGAGIELRGSSFTYDGGLGLHLKLSRDLFLEPGLHYSASSQTADASGAPNEQQFHYMTQLGYRAGNKLDLLGGAGLRHTFIGGSGARFAPELQAGVAFF
jgi:hypothetical protein